MGHLKITSLLSALKLVHNLPITSKSPRLCLSHLGQSHLILIINFSIRCRAFLIILLTLIPPHVFHDHHLPPSDAEPTSSLVLFLNSSQSRPPHHKHQHKLLKISTTIDHHHRRHHHRHRQDDQLAGEPCRLQHLLAPPSRLRRPAQPC